MVLHGGIFGSSIDSSVSELIFSSYNLGNVFGKETGGVLGGDVGASRCFNIGKVEGENPKGAVGKYNSECQYERLYYTGDICKGFGAWVKSSEFKQSFYITILGSEGFDFSASPPSLSKVDLTIEGLEVTNKKFTTKLLYEDKSFVPYEMNFDQEIRNDLCYYPTSATTNADR